MSSGTAGPYAGISSNASVGGNPTGVSESQGQGDLSTNFLNTIIAQNKTNEATVASSSDPSDLIGTAQNQGEKTKAQIMKLFGM